MPLPPYFSKSLRCRGDVNEIQSPLANMHLCISASNACCYVFFANQSKVSLGALTVLIVKQLKTFEYEQIVNYVTALFLWYLMYVTRQPLEH